MKTTFVLTIAFYLVALTLCQDDAAETAAADDMQNQPGMQFNQDPYCQGVQCGIGMMCISVPDPMGGMGGVGGIGVNGGVGGTGGVGGIGVGVGVGIGGSGSIGGIGGIGNVRIPVCVNIRTSCPQLTGSYTMGGLGGIGGIGMGKRQLIPNQQQSPYLGVFVPRMCTSDYQCNQMIGGTSTYTSFGLFACCPVQETYTNVGGFPGGMGRRQIYGQGRYVSRCIARPAYVATYSGFQGGIGMGMDEAQEGSA